jgi:hypothetical protein
MGVRACAGAISLGFGTAGLPRLDKRIGSRGLSRGRSAVVLAHVADIGVGNELLCKKEDNMSNGRKID